MDIQGKIIAVLPEQSGTSRAGNPWKKREYVLETLETFPRKVAFNFFGDRADQYPLNIGDEVRLTFDLESREFNGRWYTDVRGIRAERVTAAPVTPAAAAAPAPAGYPLPPVPEIPADLGPAPGATDDLPF